MFRIPLTLLLAVPLLANAAAYPLTVGTVDKAKRGWDFANGTDKRSVTFNFRSDGSALRLTARGYDIDSVKEVAVLVNGKRLGNLPKTADDGFGGFRFDIPARMVPSGDAKLVFKQRRPGWRWGVTNVLLKKRGGPSLAAAKPTAKPTAKSAAKPAGTFALQRAHDKAVTKLNRCQIDLTDARLETAEVRLTVADLRAELKTRSAGGKKAVQKPGGTRNKIVSSNPNDPLTTDAMSSWHVRGTVNTVLSSGRTVFVGGDFTNIYSEGGGSLPRRYLAAMDRFTGEPTDFAPDLDDEVWALAMSPDRKTLYVGGSFLTAEGLKRKRLAAYDVETGALRDIDTPSPNGALRAIAVTDGRVYIGGVFTKVGDTKRSYVAAFDPKTGEVDGKFSAALDGRVTSMALSPGRLWIGGDFERIDGARQKGVAALDRGDGSLQKTDDLAYPVIALSASDTQLFVAGGGRGGRAAAFKLANGTKQWEISSDGNFQAVGLVDEGRYVYFGGHYEAIEGNKSVDRLTRHDKRTGRTDVSWFPQINGVRSINAIDVTANGVHVGGDFTKAGGKRHEGFAIFSGLTE